jgi:hypothetical protein
VKWDGTKMEAAEQPPGLPKKASIDDPAPRIQPSKTPTAMLSFPPALLQMWARSHLLLGGSLKQHLSATTRQPHGRKRWPVRPTSNVAIRWLRERKNWLTTPRRNVAESQQNALQHWQVGVGRGMKSPRVGKLRCSVGGGNSCQ